MRLAEPDPFVLVARTTFIEDPGPLLSLLPARGALSWLRGDEGIVGWGEVDRWEDRFYGPSEDRFEAAQHWWTRVSGAGIVRDEVNLPGTGLVAFGTFTFDKLFSPRTRHSLLVIPEVVVGRRDGATWLTTISRGLAPHASLPRRPRPRDLVPADESSDTARERRRYKIKVRHVLDKIASGDVEKVVLSRQQRMRFESKVDVRTPLRHLVDEFPTCWTFHIDGFLGSTPELLVRQELGMVTSRVLAGTMSSTGDAAVDDQTAAALANSAKDLREHRFAADSVSSVLRERCRATNVPDSPFVLRLPNVMHLATDITGIAKPGSTSLGLAGALHPTAAVGGTPTENAVPIIRRWELDSRGRYAGPVGWVSADGDGEWGIGLRSAQLTVDGRTATLYAGGGIVADSDPETELAETDAKFRPMLGALGRDD